MNQWMKCLISSKNWRIHSQLGVNPDEIIVTGGVLSSNASESHLLGKKTREELLEEKNEAFVGIRQMLADRSISLAQASGLKHEIELVYNSKLQEFSSKQKILEFFLHLFALRGLIRDHYLLHVLSFQRQFTLPIDRYYSFTGSRLRVLYMEFFLWIRIILLIH